MRYEQQILSSEDLKLAFIMVVWNMFGIRRL